jgi:hypothetical protein
MDMKEFEIKITEGLGYKSLAAFADKTKLVSRSSFSKWRISGEVPALMAAYVDSQLVQNSKKESICKINLSESLGSEDVYITNTKDFALFGDEEQLSVFKISNDWMEPEYRLGDMVLAKPFKESVHEGYWLFQVEDKIVFGLLSLNFDGTILFQRSLKHDASLHFGKKHFDRIKPIGNVKYHIRERG